MRRAGLMALRLDHALGGAVLVLAAIAVWPWLAPLVSPPPPRAAPLEKAPPALAPLPPITSFAETIERPLFAPTRRPQPGGNATEAPVEGTYRLLGIVGEGSRRTALVASGNRRVNLAVGDTLGEWSVREIGQDRVVLSSATGATTLKLSRGAPEPATPR
jgi:general secretion pathway protein N